MTMTLKDIFKEFEDEVVRLMVRNKEYIEANNGLGWNVDLFDIRRIGAVRNFSLVKSFIKAQPLENQRDLWNTTVDLLNDSVVLDRENIEELMVDCFKELENLNKETIHLQLANKPDTTVKGNAEKANKPDTAVKGNAKKAKKANKPDAKFNWQGEQTQLVYLIEKLYEHGFLSPIIQPEKHRLTAQHFTVKGKNLNQKNLARTRYNSLDTKKGKPKEFEKIDQIISAAEKQNPSKPKQNPRQP